MGKRMLEWDDLQFVLAVNRTQSLTGAAVTLGVSYPTVFRRLNQLEQRLEIRLFERASGHYRPTSAGERIILASERIEAEVVAVEREVAGRDAGLSGRLRIIASEALAYRVLNKLFADFQKQHKGIELELVTDSRQLDLSRREADVAIRTMRPKEDDMFGRKVADVAWAVYGSEAYFSSRRTPKNITDLGGCDFIGWDCGAGLDGAKWIAQAAPLASVVYRSSSPINHLMAAKAGIGLALLPCYLGDGEPELARIGVPVAELARELWLITHKDLQKTAWARTFLDMIGNGLACQRDLFEGRGSAALSAAVG
jgi:DNA-binding transcriptional LysR family regulator